MQGLPIEYHRHAIEKTGAVADKPSTLVFKRLKEAVELRIIAAENVKQIAVLPEEDILNVQLIQELRQQGNKLDRQREGRLLDLRKHVTLLNQAVVQSPAQGYSSAPGYEDWQNSTRAPFVPQDCQYPQDPQHPQDSTAFGRPQWDAWGQRGTRGQGRRTCFGCGGSHHFTKHKCQGLKDLIQQGFVHLSNKGRLVAGTRERPGPVLPWLGNEGRLEGIKNWLRTY